MNFEQMKRQLGSLEGGPELPIRTHDNVNMAIPESWDAAETFPACSTPINIITDQSDCGSCWAMAVTSSASDRLCIKNEGNTTVQLSARELLSCCETCGRYCDGGMPSSAWQYLQIAGIVTGGNYGDFSLCSSYPLQPCGHHVDTFSPRCDDLFDDTPQCHRYCDKESSYPLPFAKDKIKFGKPYGVVGQTAMQKELMLNGPFVVAMTVFADFLLYKSGVYRHSKGSQLGGHAVTLVGWGVDENGTKYWRIKNSWNESWGEKGFFRIVRAEDHCSVESRCTAAEAPFVF
jgi:cathepsin B